MVDITNNQDGTADTDADALFAEFAAKKSGVDETHAEVAPEPREAAAAEAPASAPATGSETAPVVPAEPDIWASAPPELIASRDALIAERDRLEALDRTQRGRVAALNRRVEELSRQPTPAAVPATAEANDATKALDDKIKQLKDDYPEVAAPLVEMLEAQRSQIEGLKSAIGGVVEERSQAKVQHDVAELTKLHPDAPTIGSSEDFKGWLLAQPESVRKLSESWDVRETSALLTLFKTERDGSMQAPSGQQPQPGAGAQQPDARRAKQLEGNRAVTSRPLPAASGAPDDPEGQFAYFAKRKEQQLASERRR